MEVNLTFFRQQILLPATFDALANSICHARMTLSGIHDFNRLQSGFPIKIASGMTICETIIFDLVKYSNEFPSGNGFFPNEN
jgi:hypothetical protein